MVKLNHFFWFCSGAHIPSLQKVPTEQAKYFGIGATIFFTGLFATIAGAYAMYFVCKGNSMAPLITLLFGVLWGLAIFNMDRYIVSSIHKNTSLLKQCLQATPRILLAIFIGMVISRPLELKIFDKEIKAQLRNDYLKQQRERIVSLNRNFDDKYQSQIKRLNEMKSEKESVEKEIREDRQQLNFEIFGNKTKETSGIMGYGPYAKRKEVEIRNKEANFNHLLINIADLEAALNRQKQEEGILEEKLLSGKALDSLVNEAGFADRNAALHDLKFDTSGQIKESTYWAISFINLLFVFFECLPVFVKLMSAKGPYDQLVSDLNETYIFQSAADKESNIEVADQLKKVKTETTFTVQAEALRKMANII